MYQFEWGDDREPFAATYPGTRDPDHIDYSTIHFFTDFGNCIPDCAPEESLFELIHFSGDYGGGNWRLVEDVTTIDGDATVEGAGKGEEIIGCKYLKGCSDTNIFREEYSFIRSCVPSTRDHCLRFLFGARISNSNEGLLYKNDNILVKVDGGVIAQDNNAQFAAVDFGDACVDACGENESLFEFLMHRNQLDNENPPLSYKLQGVGSRAEEVVLEHTFDSPAIYNRSANSLPINYDIIHYARECIARDGCYEFEVSLPYLEWDERNHSWDEGHYQLKKDGIVWRNSEFSFGTFRDEHNQTTNVGSCKVGELCQGGEPQLLLEVTTSTDPSDNLTENIFWGVSHENGTDGSFGSNHYFREGFPPGSTFKTVGCFPDDEVVKHPNDTTVKVEKNSVELDCRLKQDGVFDGYAIAPLNGTCGVAQDSEAAEEAMTSGTEAPTSSSSGASSASISIVGSVAVLMTAIFTKP
ncbi:unknown protein [Seminavis robusta]|uniref:Uncharacterized protein n=1 Tax=Seminavis robusta TaxID=568900 RepID=A0A9N8ER98_9STRA|nr:unknown protein [Seminavis robusta]|eukprot:Sro1488_g276900.1 n/a (468) ;mRNA; r:22790-24193